MLLRNGGRLHLEAASRPEYATPECGSVPDLVVHDKAGERILEGLLADAGQRLREEGDAGDISVLKSQRRPGGRSYGCQEDYLVARRGEFGRLADILIPFLVTRQLICGAGAVVQTPRGAVYCLSRPAGHHRERPVVRGHPVQAAHQYPRRAARRRGVAAAARDRQRLHHERDHHAAQGGRHRPRAAHGRGGHRAAGPDPGQPGPAIGEVSRDITGRSRVRLADGRQMSALDIQREYLARARDFTGRRGADAVSRRVLGLWERALDAIGTGNLDAIAREIDWVIKYQLIERYRADT